MVNMIILSRFSRLYGGLPRSPFPSLQYNLSSLMRTGSSVNSCQNFATDGILSLIPTAKVGHIGAYRNEETLQPCSYFTKFPDTIADSYVLLVDPMLATGGSVSYSIQVLKDYGVKDIIYMGVVGAPEGVKKVQEDHPDIDIYLAALDEKLNEKGYIVPGLGDCGDRLFGTK